MEQRDVKEPKDQPGHRGVKDEAPGQPSEHHLPGRTRQEPEGPARHHIGLPREGCSSDLHAKVPDTVDIALDVRVRNE